MALFPWEDWFYDIDNRSKQLTNTWNQYQTSRDELLIKSDRLGEQIEFLQFLTLYNNSLLLNIALVHMSKDDYTTFLLGDKTKEPVIESDAIDAVVDKISGALGFGIAARAIWYLGKGFQEAYVSAGFAEAAKTPVELATLTDAAAAATTAGDATAVGAENAVADTTLGLADAAQHAANGAAQLAAGNTTEATSAAAEARATAETALKDSAMSFRLAAVSGAAVVVLFGVDILLGCLKGASEKKNILEAEAELQESVDAIDDLLKQLDQDIADAKAMITKGLDNFVALIDFMKPYVTPSVPYDHPTDDYTLTNYGTWRTTIETLADQYLLISKIKNSFTTFRTNYLADNPGEDFTQTEYDQWLNFRLGTRPTRVTEAQMRTIIDYVAERTEDMKAFAG